MYIPDVVGDALLLCRVVSDYPVPYPDDDEMSQVLLQNTTLEYTLAALAAIVQEAGSRFGARDLRRVVRKRVEDPVAEKLIAGEPISHLLLDAEGGKLLLQNKDQ